MIASLDLARFPLGVAEREALTRFRAGPLSRWDGARERLALTMRPMQGFGIWGGGDPLARVRSEPADGPVVLLTHSRTRAGSFRRFLATNRAVVRAAERAEGRLWSDGYIDEPLRLDSGTVSIWRDTGAATAFAYGPGVHQGALKAQRAGAWFPESWFGRFAIEAAEGSWRGLPKL